MGPSGDQRSGRDWGEPSAALRSAGSVLWAEGTPKHGHVER